MLLEARGPDRSTLAHFDSGPQGSTRGLGLAWLEAWSYPSVLKHILGTTQVSNQLMTGARGWGLDLAFSRFVSAPRLGDRLSVLLGRLGSKLGSPRDAAKGSGSASTPATARLCSASDRRGDLLEVGSADSSGLDLGLGLAWLEARA